MNAKVYYHSLTGNTKKLAAAIAGAVGAEARDLAAGPVEADLLFIGAAAYATSDHDVAPEVKAFIAGLDPKKVRRAAVFSTGFERSDTVGKLRKLLAGRGIAVADRSFFCKGKFAIFQMGRPNAEDLRLAANWASGILKG